MKIERIRTVVVQYGKALAIYMIFTLLITWVIASKENFFIDELYSYGLANHISKDGISFWMQPELAPYTYSSGGQPYYDYLTVKEGESFNFVNVWKNQSIDTHPPLYYLIIHIICSFFPGRFTRWVAGIVNIVFALLILGGVRALLKELLGSGKDLTIISLFFIFSPGILYAVSFLRMYVMLMCEITWVTWLVLRWQGKECRRFYLQVGLLSVAGLLTHYYFVLYLFSLSLLYGISLLMKKEYGKAIKYSVTMFSAGGAAVLIFPSMIRHIFGKSNHGEQAFSALKDSLGAWGAYLRQMFGRINQRWFGGTLTVVLVVFLFCFLLKIKGGYNVKKDSFWKWAIPCGAVAGYLLLVARVTVSRGERYYVSVYAVFAVVLLAGGKVLLSHVCSNRPKMAEIFFCLWIVLILIGGWREGIGDYLFKDSKPFLEAMEGFGHLDALYVWPGDRRVLHNFLDMSKVRSVTFFENNLSELEYMEELKQKPDFLLYVPKQYGTESDREKELEALEVIKPYCPQITRCELVGSFGKTTVYHAYSVSE